MVVLEGWEKKKLNQLLDMKSGLSITERLINDFDTYPCYGGNGLRGYTASYTHQGNFALVGRQGALCGNVAFVSGTFFASEHAIVVTPFQNTNIKYIYYVLDAMKLNKYSESSAQPGLSVTKILELSYLVPNEKNEQTAIAEALSDVDNLIISLEKLSAKKKAIKQGAMQELLTGKKRLPGFSGEWKHGKWCDVLEGFSSGATPYRGIADYYIGNIKWVSSGELNYNLITETIEHISEKAKLDTSLTMHPPGIFLMAITGLEAEGTRGSCAILGTQATTNQSCMAIYGTEKMNIKFLYYYYVFNGNNLAFQYCQGTKQQSYTAKIVKILPIYYPIDTTEQTAIASILSDMDAEIEQLEKKLAKYRLIKQGMMQELLTGRIRLNQ